MQGPVAVITGDMIDSRKLDKPTRKRIPDLLRSAVDALVPVIVEEHTEVDIFRGDSWQILLWKPHRAVRACLFMRAFLLSQKLYDDLQAVQARMAIGIGEVDFVHEQRVSQSEGPAFQASGRLLDELSSRRRALLDVRFTEEYDRSGAGATAQAAAAFCSAAVRGWTPHQAVAVCGALRGQSQAETAQAWPGGSVTQQNVSKHLAEAGWDYIERGLRFTEQFLRSHLQPP
jgi:hypothetical protein